MDSAMPFIASALNPIPAIAWGEIAMGFLGVGIVLNVSASFVSNQDQTLISQRII